MSAAAAFVGTWDVVIATPIGKQLIVLRLAEQNGILNGTAESPAEKVDCVGLVADGMRLCWTQQVTKPLRLTLRFDVVVDGDSMQGTAKAGILPTSRLTGTRRPVNR